MKARKKNKNAFAWEKCMRRTFRHQIRSLVWQLATLKKTSPNTLLLCIAYLYRLFGWCSLEIARALQISPVPSRIHTDRQTQCTYMQCGRVPFDPLAPSKGAFQRVDSSRRCVPCVFPSAWVYVPGFGYRAQHSDTALFIQHSEKIYRHRQHQRCYCWCCCYYCWWCYSVLFTEAEKKKNQFSLVYNLFVNNFNVISSVTTATHRDRVREK